MYHLNIMSMISLFTESKLEINEKEKIGIYSQSGNGKTTLINIIAGLLDPSNGERLVNKKNYHLLIIPI